MYRKRRSRNDPVICDLSQLRDSQPDHVEKLSHDRGKTPYRHVQWQCSVDVQGIEVSRVFLLNDDCARQSRTTENLEQRNCYGKQQP